MSKNPRIDNARVIRAAHGTTLQAKSWLTEAPVSYTHLTLPTILRV